MANRAKILRDERERRLVIWAAEEARVKALGNLFSALPKSDATRALRLAMRDRIIFLYNECRFAEGDAILEFLPNEFAKQILDWYFHEPHTSDAPDPPTGEDEDLNRKGRCDLPSEGTQRPCNRL